MKINEHIIDMETLDLTSTDIISFKNKMQIYSSRIKNLIKEANELVAKGNQLGNPSKVRYLRNDFFPEFESIGHLGNFGFICCGTSLKNYERNDFKIKGLGIRGIGIFGKSFLISIPDNKLKIDISEKMFNSYGFKDFGQFEKMFECFEKHFYNYVDNL
jgi:hypothetical protein